MAKVTDHQGNFEAAAQLQRLRSSGRDLEDVSWGNTKNTVRTSASCLPEVDCGTRSDHACDLPRFCPVELDSEFGQAVHNGTWGVDFYSFEWKTVASEMTSAE